MEALLKISSEIVLGYFLQSISCMIWLTTFYNGSIKRIHFWGFSLFLTAEMFIVRNLPITFGIHTILSIITIILIAIWYFKINVYQAAIIGSLTAVLILVCEFIVYIGMQLLLGEEILSIFIGTKTYMNKIPGNIANVLFFLMVTIVNIVFSKKSKLLIKGDLNDGKYVP